MGYEQAAAQLKGYRSTHRRVLLGQEKGWWFTTPFSSVKDLFGLFESEEENAEIAARYASGTVNERIPGHLKLDYVCGMRREVRKQYASGEDGVYTDVTPFRHGIISAFGAEIFDNAFDQVLNRKAK